MIEIIGELAARTGQEVWYAKETCRVGTTGGVGVDGLRKRYRLAK